MPGFGQQSFVWHVRCGDNTEIMSMKTVEESLSRVGLVLTKKSL
jgi:hypothetical protein